MNITHDITSQGHPARQSSLFTSCTYIYIYIFRSCTVVTRPAQGCHSTCSSLLSNELPYISFRAFSPVPPSSPTDLRHPCQRHHYRIISFSLSIRFTHRPFSSSRPRFIAPFFARTLLSDQRHRVSVSSAIRPLSPAAATFQLLLFAFCPHNVHFFSSSFSSSSTSFYRRRPLFRDDIRFFFHIKLYTYIVI